MRQEGAMASPSLHRTTRGPTGKMASPVRRPMTREGPPIPLRLSTNTRCIRQSPTLVRAVCRGFDGRVGSSPVETGPVITTTTTATSPSFSFSLSSLNEALRAEVEHLASVTKNLRQRLDDVKRNDIKCSATGERSTPVLPAFLPHSKSKLIGSPGSQKRTQQQSENIERSPFIRSFTPGRPCRRDANVQSQCKLPRKTLSTDDDETVLTSLRLFQYTPKPESARDVEIGCIESWRGEGDGAAALEASHLPVHSATVRLESPSVVELQTTTRTVTGAEASLEAGADGTRDCDAPKQALLRARVLSVGEDLNRYMSDIFALQCDFRNAQNEGLMDPHNPSVCDLRLMIHEELNACNIRISRLASLNGLVSGEHAHNCILS